MAEGQRYSDELGTVYRVTYADWERAWFTEPDYQRERLASEAPERVAEHRIIAAEAFRDARFEAHYGWWMLTGLDAEGRRVDLGDTTEPELQTLALSPTVARQLEFPLGTMRDTSEVLSHGSETTFGRSDESPGEGNTVGSRLEEVADKVRDLFSRWRNRQHDHGMGL
jgi:hypothetical protein